MTLRCKVGDLAITLGQNPNSGRIVEVLHLAPTNVVFKLPDGATSTAVSSGTWVVKACGQPFKAKMQDFSYRRAWYGCVEDFRLRPITPPGVTEEITEELEVTL